VQVLLLLLLGVVLWAVYRPALFGPYVFDDFQNITLNHSIAIDNLSLSELLGAAFSKAEGNLGRPIAMASFALNYFFAEKSFAPFAFKLTNLLIHITNVMLVYLLIRLLFQLPRFIPGGQKYPISKHRAALMAIFTAALWGLHPLQLTSVLYTVQRMTSLSAFFVIVGMLVFLHGRRKLSTQPTHGLAMMTVGVGGGTFLGLFCKENAILLPLLAATAEVGFFSRDELARVSRHGLAVFYLCLLGVPVFLGVTYLIFNPEFVLQTYATRSFGITERILTESRVLFFYLSLIAFPLVSRFGLYHDDFALSTGLLDPPWTLLALVAWALVALALIKGLRQRNIWAFGLAWFLAGHVLESSILGLEIIHEHRNYVPSIGICMAAAYYLVALFEKLGLPPRSLVICGVCALLTFGFVTHTRALFWSSRTQLFESLVQHHPESYRAISGLATSMGEQRRDVRPVYNALRDAALASTSTAHPLIEMKKILNALILGSENLGLGKTGATAVDSSSVTWFSDLVLDHDHLLLLDEVLSQEISRRLVAGNIHIETTYALWRAQACVTEQSGNCASMKDEVTEWHLAVLRQLPLGDRRRGMLELSAAKLYAEAGNLDKAFEYMNRALETASGHPRYRAQKALLLLKIGAVAQAEGITDSIAQEMDWRRIYAKDVEVLRREIEKAKIRRGEGQAHVDSKVNSENASLSDKASRGSYP
jgi:hypothetical protein